MDKWWGIQETIRFRENNPVNIDATKKHGKDAFLAYGLVFTSDKRRDGDLQENLDNDFILGMDQYPKTVNKGYDQLLHYNKFKPRENCRSTTAGVAFTTT